MVAINDFCWSAFLTKSALFLKFAPWKKNSGAPAHNIIVGHIFKTIDLIFQRAKQTLNQLIIMKTMAFMDFDFFSDFMRVAYIVNSFVQFKVYDV